MKHANLKRFIRTSALVVALGILASQGAPVEAVLRKDQRKAMNTYVLEQVKKDPEFWSTGAFGEDREALRLVLSVRAICAFGAVPELRYVPEREQDGIAENTVGYFMGGEGRVAIRVAAEKSLGGAFAGGRGSSRLTDDDGASGGASSSLQLQRGRPSCRSD